MIITRFAVAVSVIAVASGAAAQDRPGDARRTDLLRQRDAIEAPLRALDSPPPPAPRTPTSRAATEDIVVTGGAVSPTTVVAGQTVTTVDDSTFRNMPATTIADIVKLSPGVAAHAYGAVNVVRGPSSARYGNYAICAGQPRSVFAGLKSRF